LLTIMALSLTTSQRTETALTSNQIEGARFRALADAALNLVALNLLSDPTESVPVEEVWVPDGVPRTIQFDGESVQVTLFNEGSRIDLNAATREQLSALIEIAQGTDAADETKRNELVDAILDWRDADNLKQLNGAEDEDYQAAGMPYGAGDKPFQSVEELRQVLGMTLALYQRLEPDLRVASEPRANRRPSSTSSIGSGRGGAPGAVDLTFASAAVLAAIQGISLEDAQSVIDARKAVSPDDQQNTVLQRGGPLYRIRVASVQGAQLRMSMEALLELRPGGSPPFDIQWRRFGVAHQRADAQ